MIASKSAARTCPRLSQQCVRCRAQQRRNYGFRPVSPYAVKRQTHLYRSVVFVAAGGSLTAIYTWYTGGPEPFRDVHAEGPPSSVPESPNNSNAKPMTIDPKDLVFEETRKPLSKASKDELRDQISSQHLQVRKSWESPGVWIWGDNNGKVAAPDAKEGIVRNPRWMKIFDGQLLRDLKLTRSFGAAIDEKGDLLQWGSAYNPDVRSPVHTLKGKDLASIAVSDDRILALSRSGKVYSLSVSAEEQTLGPKPTETSWWMPIWSSSSPISYRVISPSGLGYTERVTGLSSGLEHALLMTSAGRVFSFASASSTYPTRGQLGVPGLTWFTRPKGAYDAPQEVAALHGFKITQIAAGDYHSVALDNKGRVHSWGDNQKGQLGIGDTSKDNTYFDAPAMVPLTKLYAGTGHKPSVSHIYAGGNTTFLSIDATRIATPDDEENKPLALRMIGRVTSDTWACGHGIWGQLGNGRWTHVQSLPTKIIPLSGLFEYDEVKRRAVPIKLRDISIGANHAAATMSNITYTEANANSSENDTNWGADVLFFGNNEFYQLGTGRRNNVTSPTYIQPLYRAAESAEGKRPKDEIHRFHATPRSTVRVGNRWVSFEQRIACGRGVTAVYSGV